MLKLVSRVSLATLRGHVIVTQYFALRKSVSFSPSRSPPRLHLVTLAIAIDIPHTYPSRCNARPTRLLHP